MKRPLESILKTLLDLAEITLIGVVISTLAFLFVGQPVKVVGDSMLPNFKNGEQIIAEKISLKKSGIERGDVVIVEHPKYPGILLIKRVVGLPGEKIKIAQGHVYINDSELTEPYLDKETTTETYGVFSENANISIPQNFYVVFGDNRDNSSDSREWGPISKNAIVGKSYFVYFPFSSVRIVKKTS